MTLAVNLIVAGLLFYLLVIVVATYATCAHLVRRRRAIAKAYERFRIYELGISLGEFAAAPKDRRRFLIAIQKERHPGFMPASLLAHRPCSREDRLDSQGNRPESSELPPKSC